MQPPVSEGRLLHVTHSVTAQSRRVSLVHGCGSGQTENDTCLLLRYDTEHLAALNALGARPFDPGPW